MRTRSRIHLGILAGMLILAPLAALIGQPDVARAEDFDQTFTFRGSSLQVTNLIGELHIEGHSGDSFEVVAQVRGTDASRERITFDVQEGDQARFQVRFPLKEKNEFVYPELGSGSTTIMTRSDGDVDEQDWLDRLLKEMNVRRLKISGDGDGLEVWVDLFVKVPAQKTLRVDLAVGDVAATEAAANLHLVTKSGSISAHRVRGDLMLETASGDIEASEIDGETRADTGSGSIRLTACRAQKIHLDTGSGNIETADAVCQELSLDTGSGRIRADRIEADDVSLDTGSGSVELSLQRADKGRIRIDTGSGSIALRLPVNASADVQAETGSGGIDVDLDGVDLQVRERDFVAFRVGGGEAEIDLETGSGSIRVGH